ncbi:dATP/dGTP pyrophosphohydrolase domain-containing protein [Atlantibacter hermannii]|uniref:dATP/dGTP pyrophosphohydrolase domain-containing protein n=1 Tax=Atlantibacter hermannii TaxID=565 RepID=UPI0033323469
MTDGINDREHVRREHAEWSQATFGNVGPIGPLKHLSKEALEAAAAPEDLSEWADMQFLLWDAQRRAGITDEQITQAMVEKLAVNKQREWPEPKDGEPRLHIAAPAVQAEQLSVDTLANVLRNAPVAPCDSQGKKRGNPTAIPDGWISVSELMPEFNDEVLVWHRHGFPMLAVYGACRDPKTYKTYRCLRNNDGEIDATHWMPLPAAPKQEAE